MAGEHLLSKISIESQANSHKNIRLTVTASEEMNEDDFCVCERERKEERDIHKREEFFVHNKSHLNDKEEEEEEEAASIR